MGVTEKSDGNKDKGDGRDRSNSRDRSKDPKKGDHSKIKDPKNNKDNKNSKDTKSSKGSKENNLKPPKDSKGSKENKDPKDQHTQHLLPPSGSLSNTQEPYIEPLESPPSPHESRSPSPPLTHGNTPIESLLNTKDMAVLFKKFAESIEKGKNKRDRRSSSRESADARDRNRRGRSL